MHLKIFVCIVLLLPDTSALEGDYCERDENGACKTAIEEPQCDDEDEPCFMEDAEDTKKENKAYPDFKTLTRLRTKKVGDQQTFEIGGRKLTLHTKSLRPLLFEIPDAISKEEIQHVMEKTKNPNFSGGMFTSEARGGLTPEDSFKLSSGHHQSDDDLRTHHQSGDDLRTTPGKGLGPGGIFRNWDINKDGKIDLDEAEKFCKNYNFLYFNEDDVSKMIKVLDLKEFDDGIVTEDEFDRMNTLGIEDYLNVMMREHPKHRQRTSDQAWLPMAHIFDPVLSNIRYRFGELLKIPEKILLGSEHMQVVRYQKDGHYHAHHDSETEKARDKPCCHHTSTETVKQFNKCRLCRFITVMVYLNTPEEGGETAFPAADNITYSDAAFRRRGTDSVDLFNLSEHCHDANLVVKAEAGKAVVWYNHLLDKSGWMGALDEWALHGGCGVKKGEKWIMNIWLTAPYKDSVEKLSMYSMEYAMSAEHNKDE